MRLAYVLVAPSLVISGLAVVPITVAPTAAADCTSSGGTTLCSQGDSRGTDSGSGPSGGADPYVPYPCGYDWYCNDDYGWGVVLDLDPGWPGIGGPGGPGIGGPGIGGPGRPEVSPRSGGGSRGGGGGRRGGRR